MPHQGVQEDLIAFTKVYGLFFLPNHGNVALPLGVPPLFGSRLRFQELDLFVSPVHEAAIDVHQDQDPWKSSEVLLQLLMDLL